LHRHAPWPLLTAVALGAVACGTSPQGIDPDLLAQAYAHARQTPGIRSLLVQRHSVLVGEEYFHGGAADSLEHVWSVTKSVTSILIGMALERGYLTGLDRTLDEFLTPIVDSLPRDKGRITLRQLLTMTSGLQWHEFDGGGEYGRWVTSDDMLQYVIDRPWASQPGEAFLYNTGGTHLLSAVLTVATGATELDFARQHLFGPLGITQADWWTDERGYSTGGMGLHLRPRDMVKIGELFLRRGVWNGKAVVSGQWVQESTTPHISTGNAVWFGPEYGYLWWIGHGQGHDFYFANGFAGQFIFVVPELDLVIVATSGWHDLDWNSAGVQWSGVMDVIVNHVLPAVGG
jgi:CubicO group peptidase (beta-lactamase class C family)